MILNVQNIIEMKFQDIKQCVDKLLKTNTSIFLLLTEM